jgi:nucleoside transporter
VIEASPSTPRWKLATLFFINAAAIGMWNVPFGNVLKAHGLESIIGYAYACSGVAAFISPLAVGALADQAIPPAKLVRWLSVMTATFLALAFTAIEHGWGAWTVLACIQAQSICAAPIFGLSTSLIMSALTDPERQFGPLRAWATFGWMAAGWVVSFALRADTSTLAGYAAAATWLLTATFTFMLPETAPLERKDRRTWSDILGFAALELFRNKDHRVVFLAASLFNIPMAAFYPFTPIQLTELGVKHATAAMTLGQVSELFCMFALGWLLARWRLKWIFLTGIGAGIVRFAVCAFDTRGWVLTGISLHGFAYTLYFITAQIYLEQRVDPRLRARAQALLVLMVSGFGNLIGYLSTGWWRQACTDVGQTRWPVFWLGISSAAAAVFFWFVVSYRGKKGGT